MQDPDRHRQPAVAGDPPAEAEQEHGHGSPRSIGPGDRRSRLPSADVNACVIIAQRRDAPQSTVLTGGSTARAAGSARPSRRRTPPRGRPRSARRAPAPPTGSRPARARGHWCSDRRGRHGTAHVGPRPLGRHHELGQVAHVADEPHHRLGPGPDPPALGEVQLVVQRGDLHAAGGQVGEGRSGFAHAPHRSLRGCRSRTSSSSCASQVGTAELWMPAITAVVRREGDADRAPARQACRQRCLDPDHRHPRPGRGAGRRRGARGPGGDRRGDLGRPARRRRHDRPRDLPERRPGRSTSTSPSPAATCPARRTSRTTSRSTCAGGPSTPCPPMSPTQVERLDAALSGEERARFRAAVRPGAGDSLRRPTPGKPPRQRTAGGRRRQPARARSSAPARSSPASSPAWTSTITSTVASSFTTATLATTPAVPTASRAATRPSSSPAPTGASTPESQAESTTRYGGVAMRSKSCTSNGPSARSRDEKSGESARKCPCAATCASAAPSSALESRVDRRGFVTQHDGGRVVRGDHVDLGSARRQPRPGHEDAAARSRRHARALAGPEPQSSGGDDAVRYAGQHREQPPRGGVQR